jgi:hypothetical protein
VCTQEVPEAVKPRLNFFNVGVSFNRSSPEYVFNIMRELYRPGDYIVSATARPYRTACRVPAGKRGFSGYPE